MKSFLLVPVIAALALMGGVANGEQAPVQTLQKYCSDCHGGKKTKGDFDLDILGPQPNEITLPAWMDVLDLIQNEEMPPEDEPQPTNRERADLVTWLTKEIDVHKAASFEKQKVKQMRRLTPAQYWNTLNSLMGAKHIVHTPIPDFDVGKARDNYQLAMTPEHLDSFMRIAEEAITYRIQPFRPAKTGKLSYSPHSKKYGLLSQKTFKNSFVSLDNSVGILNNGNTKWGVHTLPFEISTWPVKVPGRYRIRVTARAHSEKSQAPVKLGVAVRYHAKMLHAKGVDGSRTIRQADLKPGPKFVVTECEVVVGKGETITVQKLSGKHDGGQKKGVPAHSIREHLLLVKNIEIEGPLIDSWPSPEMKHLFGDFPKKPTEKEAIAMLNHFAEKAFRRPLTKSQTAQIEQFFRQRLTTPPRPFNDTIWTMPTRGDHRYKNRFRGAVSQNTAYPPETDWKIESAVVDTCISILMNRQFLFQFEPDQPDGFSTASRLAFFLWNSPPDEKLLGAAKAGILNTREGKLKAASYCLDHKNAKNFFGGFVEDWLGTDQVGVMEPDKQLYGKRYDDELRRAMRKQPVEVFQAIVNNRKPASAMLKSDWTMVNERLAKHYGINGVKGTAFQQVSVNGSNAIRGSILGHAGIMSVLSNGTQTLPITRGVWVLDNLLGTPPPPPPPNIPLIEPDTRGAQTLREQLVAHRENGSCKRCHEKIDPIGIALENFDAIGGWRDNYQNTSGKKKKKGIRVDSSATLKDGTAINGPNGLARYLAKHEADFNHCLTKKLFEYATGHPLGADESAAVDDIVKKAKANHYELRSIILEVATHPKFLN